MLRSVTGQLGNYYYTGEESGGWQLMSLINIAIMVILSFYVLLAFYRGDLKFVVEICVVALILWFVLYGI